MDEQMYKPRFDGQAAYILPPLANFVSGPAGMLYNPGTALSPKYKNTFFIQNRSTVAYSDFAYSGSIITTTTIILI